MAGRPVDWMAVMMAEGGVVEVVVRREEGMEKVVDCMPRFKDQSTHWSRTIP